MLEEPRCQPDGNADLFRWVECEIGGEQRYAVRVKSFVVANSLREEMKMPYLNGWLARQQFKSVMPPGLSFIDAIEAEEKDAKTILTAFRGTGDSLLSNGALYYFNEAFQPRNSFGVFELKVNLALAPPTFPQDANLSEKIFSAYLKSSKRASWSKEPSNVVARRLALLVAMVIDISFGQLTKEIQKLIDEHDGDSSDVSSVDSDDVKQMAESLHDTKKNCYVPPTRKSKG
jgi:hypothetical protein